MARQQSKKKSAGRKASAKARKKTSHNQPLATVYETRCNWDDGDVTELMEFSEGIIGKAILRGREIVFDWITDDHKPIEHTRLSTIDGVHYEGYTVDAPGCGTDKARVEAVLYSNSQGHILLGQGIWAQEGRQESFIIQLHSGNSVEE